MLLISGPCGGDCPVCTCWIDLTAICHRGAEQASSSSVRLLLHDHHSPSHRFCGQGLRNSGWLWLRVSLEAVSHPHLAGARVCALHAAVT